MLLGGVSLVLWQRSRIEAYRAGEKTEGVVDRLARHVPDDHPRVVFTDVAREVGIEYRHFAATRQNRLPEDMGSGVALGDADGDGWCDLFLPGFTRPAAPAEEITRGALYRNVAGRFEDVTLASGIVEAGLGMAAAFVDVDSDADLDLVTTRVGGIELWRNRGDLLFEATAGPAGLADFEGFWAGVAIGDHGLDGDLDLYVCGYVAYDEAKVGADEKRSQYAAVIPARINPSVFEPERNLFLENDGTGSFVERAGELGIDNTDGRSLGAVFCDLNTDGWPDLYVANDVSDNALFLGRSDGGFFDVTQRALVGDYRGAMGLAAGDADGDLDMDLFVTHWVAQENALYSQYRLEESTEGGPAVPIFFDASEAMGLGYQALENVGWATYLFDYDNDTHTDLLVVNGSTIPLAEDDTKMEPMRSQLFWKHPQRSGFFEVGAVSGDFFREAHVGRGGAGFDFDLDGDEDLAVVLHGEGLALLRNDGGDQAGALRVRLRQQTGNRLAIGARLELVAGEHHAMALVGSDGSYLSQHAVGELAFGLGETPLVDQLIVTWPDGVVEVAGPFTPRSLVTWERGSAAREEVLPGRLLRDAERPTEAAVEREFFAIRKRATRARLDGDLELAVRTYREALLVWPDHGDSLYYLGNCLLGLGREREALHAFSRRVAYAPTTSAAWMQLGLLRLSGGDPALDDLDLAEAAFQRCHELNQEEARPLLMLGHVALLRGDLDAARAFHESAAAHNPRSVEARWHLGRLAWLAGDAARAKVLLEEAHQIAGTGQISASPSGEGDTKAGGAMTSAIEVPLVPVLTGWRGLAERTPDPASEYGAREATEPNGG